MNLFISSEAHWAEKGITIRQETRFPEQDGTTITVKVKQPVAAGINVRIPIWAAEGGSVSLNGKPLPAFASAGSYLQIHRNWVDGDKLEVKLPMRLHSEPLLGDPTQQAVLYGPIVLAGRLGTDGLTKEMQYDADHGNTELAPPRAKPAGSAEISLKSPDDIRSVAWLEPVQGQPLTFQTVGQKNATTLVPLHRIIGERYAVYWKIDSSRPEMG